MYTEEELLLLSGLQHFAFCRRQWALIHLEQVWAENRWTAEGEILHERAHDGELTEKRGGLIVCRGLRIVSYALGVTGACDVVEFHSSPEGVPLRGREGTWIPLPVEYKRGKPKAHDADEMQLCGEAMCLEEMLASPVPKGYLYYGETRRRQEVEFTPELRGRVREMLEEMHGLYRRGHTPKCRPTRACAACSVAEQCLPKLCRNPSAARYIQEHLCEEDEA